MSKYQGNSDYNISITLIERYNPDVFIENGIEYAELYIRATARQPPDCVVSEVRFIGSSYTTTTTTLII